jgi:hypothetical protein
MTILETASVLELAWTSLGVTGLVASVWSLADAYGDRAALRVAALNGPRELVARTNIRNDALRALMQSIIIMIGIIALVAPNPPPHPLTLSEVLFAGGLMTIAVVLAGLSLWDRRDRRRLIAAVLDDEDRGGCNAANH